MTLDITAHSALWFLPFVLPVCIWAAYSDLRRMTIPNTAVLCLGGIFVVIGLIALPLAEYPWRLVHLAVMLVVGIVMNAAGLMGAGDAKFIAAAAPFVALGDAATLCLIFAATLLGAFVTHRVAKHSPLRRLAPDWKSWSTGNKFPMGFALGATLALYLGLGALHGS
ncbi:prepilin peptidase [uncultured Roseovarius sp.]|uniref:A24 family peptidase n=1 Tax=uncultured Roseovarius sp. TaxID=293344 RepID=UPI0026040AB1|nr:prepilin peptidase [uncultured Roseovarius sp.]